MGERLLAPLITLLKELVVTICEHLVFNVLRGVIVGVPDSAAHFRQPFITILRLWSVQEYATRFLMQSGNIHLTIDVSLALVFDSLRQATR